MAETAWEAIYPLEPVTDSQGAVLYRQIVMRRKIDGVWHYRSASDDEVQEYKSLTAW